MADDYAEVRTLLADLVGWVSMYRLEVEAPDGAKDPMLRASLRQSMFDSAQEAADFLRDSLPTIEVWGTNG